MPIPTTDDVTENMSDDEHRRFETIARTLTGMPSDRAVALLMVVVCEVIDQDKSNGPSLWGSIVAGARKEIKLAARGRRLH
jgi:hypothetical protein